MWPTPPRSKGQDDSVAHLDPLVSRPLTPSDRRARVADAAPEAGVALPEAEAEAEEEIGEAAPPPPTRFGAFEVHTHTRVWMTWTWCVRTW